MVFPLSTQHSALSTFSLRSRLCKVALHDIAAVAWDAVGVRAGLIHVALLTGLRGAVTTAGGIAQRLWVARTAGKGLGLTVRLAGKR